MTVERVDGFMVFQGNQLIVVRDTFEEATTAAAKYIRAAPAGVKFSLNTANSSVVPGIGASAMRVWNYDHELTRWIEFIR